MNELIAKEINIENMIYEIRGKQVMLDSDLAKLYNCANGTKSINLAVKRHIKRFPERFMFQLTEDESKIIWFQFETKNGKVETRGGKFDKPFVFTEQGVSMLSAVLRTDVAEEKLIIIDRYTDKTILDMIKNLKCSVILITSKNSKLTKTDIEKYNSTYNNLAVYYDDSYHDRYFIIDKDKIYHSGNSVNYIGYRKSSINILRDSKIKKTILNDIEKILSKFKYF